MARCPVFMIAGDLAAYFLGLLIEYEWGSHASLIVRPKREKPALGDPRPSGRTGAYQEAKSETVRTIGGKTSVMSSKSFATSL
jgi:hypothetical protein